MQVHYDLNQLPVFSKSVVTIGSFDGVHAGHRRIFERVFDLSRRIGGESIVITFHPHPRTVLDPKAIPMGLLTTLDEKIHLCRQCGIDHLIIAPFTNAFSQMSAEEYVENFLVRLFQPRYIVIGYDHQFGLNRLGDIEYLRWKAERYSYEVEEIPAQEVDDITVSSTKIRQAILSGSIDQANTFLNSAFLLLGTVCHGDKLGRTLGYPTANLAIADKHKIIPADGVYAVIAHVPVGRVYQGMLHIGPRPTVTDSNRRTIEVNLFGEPGDLYDMELRLELVERIRGIERFDDTEALKQQMLADKTACKGILDAYQRRPPLKPFGLTPKQSIVILNYNGRGYLERFLPSLIQSLEKGQEIVVADNASTDDSVAFMKEQYPHIQCIVLPKNYGFAEGYNQALKQVQADYYILLNSDVEVPKGWLSPLIAAMERDPAVAACQPKIMSHDQPEVFEYAGGAGGWLDIMAYPFCRGRVLDYTETDTGQYDTVQEIFWASGAAMVIRAPLFHTFGGFDGQYFAHSEEIDLCWRFKRAGYKVICEPASKVYHCGGGTLAYDTPYKTFLNFRNSLFTIYKNEPFWKAIPMVLLRLLLDALAALLFLSQQKWQHIWMIIRAHWSFYVMLPLMTSRKVAFSLRLPGLSIGKRNVSKGRYMGSMIWKFYGEQRKTFTDIIQSKFPRF